MAHSFHRRTLLTLASAGALSATMPSLAQFRVEVSGVGLTQMPIAIAAFRGEAQAPQKIASIITANLERSGVFRAVDTAGLVADESTRPDLGTWRQMVVSMFACGFGMWCAAKIWVDRAMR
jgi:TolB protein